MYHTLGTLMSLIGVAFQRVVVLLKSAAAVMECACSSGCNLYDVETAAC
jgi:hypothetical protein